MQDKVLHYANDPLSRKDPEVEDWLEANLNEPEMDRLFDDIFAHAPRIDDPDGKKEMISMLDSLGSNGRKKRRGLAGMFSVAALIAVLAGLGLHFWLQSRIPEQKWEAEFASYGQTRSVTLPDNSRIWLHNDSKVVFPDCFVKGQRTVFADGEIYAEVTSDAKHPFIVQTQGATVKVLGTTFNLSSYSSGGKVSITLLKGKVEIDVPVPDKELQFDLVPGEQLTVDRNTGEYSQAKVDISEFSIWKDSRKFYFIDRPFKEIVVELQEAFNTAIVVKDNRLLSTRYLASFVNNESLEEILSALNMDAKMRITRKDGTYYIYPN